MKLWQLLIQLSHSPDETGLAAQKAVQQQLAQSSGTTLAWWRFWLATDARLHHQPEDLRAHLQKAYQIAPEIPQIANDLAMDLAFGQPVDLARALAVVQPVVEKFPDNPGFRDTRGRILLKLGRYAEAASDLEFASLKLSHASETEAALEEARRALGRNPTR
jgi:tetratricopeptide (TPR) repeat protein